MVEFNLWQETFIFCSIYTLVIIGTCVLVCVMGVNLFNALGRYPSKAAQIHMSIFFKLVGLEILSFSLLVLFYHVLS